MKFQHPALNEFYDRMAISPETAGVEPEWRSDPIFLLMLMVMVDRFMIAEWEAGGSLPIHDENSWSPKSPELTELIEHLLAPAQRNGLRKWYLTAEQINGAASAFRDWLGSKIGESLKPQHVGP